MSETHLLWIPREETDGEVQDGWPQWRCPYPPGGTACGLLTENKKHDPDRCAVYEEGEDGCVDHPGWMPARGCAVQEMSDGMGADELGLDDLSDVPRNRWLAVDIAWIDSLEDAVPEVQSWQLPEASDGVA